MTTSAVFGNLAGVVADLSRELPIEARYERLLDALHQTFPADAIGLLRLEAGTLQPVAVRGLSPDTLGRSFAIGDHPRFAQIMNSRHAVRFPADSALPDPYDGLIDGPDPQLHVHDCLGAALYVDDEPWGAVTLDALSRDRFDSLDTELLNAWMALAAASVLAADRVHRLEERVDRQHKVNRSLLDEGMDRRVGDSIEMKRIWREAEVVAVSDLPILILGETGVGKELVARLIHRRSARADEALIPVNCAALPESIAESELFGHARGAFSGAVEERVGRFELADGGTLFLDEVGELALPIQAKLLRVLQEGDVQRLGSDRHHRVDVRVVAATNRDLKAEVAAGRFRADLYHRLSVYPLVVPPLRERRADILPLAGHFLEALQRRMGLRGVRLSADARQWLWTYEWPGNVRELEHAISRGVVRALAEGQGRDRMMILARTHLGAGPVSSAVKEAAAGAAAGEDGGLPTMAAALERFKHELVDARLRRHDGNRAAAARSLGLDRANFHRLLKRLDLADAQREPERPAARRSRSRTSPSTS